MDNCEHCHQDIEIRNPSGYCDHLYYPAACKVCCSRDELKSPQGQRIKKLESAIAQARQERDEAQRLMHDALDERDTLKAALEKYGEHGRECILARFDAGEPTPDSGYRWKYGGKWYTELPKCQCGLTAALGGM